MADDNQLPAAQWVIYCDGSALPNPGRMGLGAVLTAPDGTRHPLSQTARGQGCNNEAELRALMAALQMALAHGALVVQVYCDSSVVVQQLAGTDAKPMARLQPLFEEARILLQSFHRVGLQWVPGHRNGEADALARAALGMAPRAPPPPPRKKRR